MSIAITGGFRPEDLAKVKNLPKQIRFAQVSALTKTAKDVQVQIQNAIPRTFRVRTDWTSERRKTGIRVRAAKKADQIPTATVSTAANWLWVHESGTPKTAHPGSGKPVKGAPIKGREKLGGGGFVAVPSSSVPRDARGIIASRNRPKNFRRSFVMLTKRGPVVAERVRSAKQGATRRGPLNEQGLVVFGFEKSVKIEKRSTFFEPGLRAAQARYATNYNRALDDAIRTAK